MSSSVVSIRSVSSSVFTRRLLLDADDDGRLGVVRSFSALDCGTLADNSDVTYQDRRRIRCLDGHCGDRVHVAETTDAADEVFLPLRNLKTRRRVLIRSRQRLLDFFERDLVGRQPCGVEHHLVLLLLTAGGNHLRDPGHGEKTTADDSFRHGAEFQRRVPVGFQIDEQHLAHDRRDRSEEWRLDVRRQANPRRA